MKINVDCQASAANMNSPICGASFHVRFDFHGCLFPFIENLLLVARLQVMAVPAPLGLLPF